MSTKDLVPSSILDQLSANELHQAFRQIGALHLKNAIDPKLINRLRREAIKAFELPTLIKAPYFRSASSSGYTPPGVEGVRDKGPDPHRHFWDVMSPERVVNRLPRELRVFRTAAFETFRRLEYVAYRVFETLDPVLDTIIPNRTAATRLLTASAGGQHMLRISEYLLGETESFGDVLFPAHKDFGLMTIYIGGAEPGLQMEIDGEWHDVDNEPGSLILACGITLNKLVGTSLYRPVPHRVVAKTKQRLSAVFFTEPRPEIHLPGGETAGEFLARKIKEVRHE